jgi:hypothetical protein
MAIQKSLENLVDLVAPASDRCEVQGAQRAPCLAGDARQPYFSGFMGEPKTQARLPGLAFISSRKRGAKRLAAPLPAAQ